MKKILVIILIGMSFFGCNKNSIPSNIDFRQEMRNFVKEISVYSRNLSPHFVVIPQNGQELVTVDGEITGTVDTSYLNSFDATGREDMFYGYEKDDEATPTDIVDYFNGYCQICEQNGVEVLATDYCSTYSFMDDSYTKNNQKAYISFAAPERNLNVIPDYPSQPYNVNLDDITKMSEAKNFLYLINPDNFISKDDFVAKVSATDYDVVIMDLFFNDGTAFTPIEIEQLKKKHNGSVRLVICYMSIGEAEDYRYYWQNDWKVGEPSWLETENSNWKGNYKVRYWEQDWKNIIMGNNNAYLDRIINAGFDGVYLDIIDGFEYFEDKYPAKE